MIAQIPWIERTWNFDFPAGYFPVFLERMRGLVPRVESMIKGIPEGDLTLKPNGKWSVKDHMGHLIDLEELHEKRLNEFIAGTETLSPADMDNRKTVEAHHSQKAVGELLRQLHETRNHFVRRLEKINDDLLERTAVHPRLKKPMRLVDMIYFVCEHDDHHLAKMRAIISTATAMTD